MVGGAFSTWSFGSSTSGKGDLYLEEAWQLDERNEFVRPLKGTTGIWIANSSISHIEFFSTKEAETNEGPIRAQEEDITSTATI